MKQLLILSGKGGTGKTTTSAAFIEFSKAKNFADCDVDAPNLHLVTNSTITPEEKNFIGSDKAFINEDKCIGCNTCKNHCRFEAIVSTDNICKINSLACEGCGVCSAVCPTDAVTMQPDIAGKLMLFKDKRTFSTAQLKMGRGTSGKLVTEVKKKLKDNLTSDANNLAIIDGSPGIGCPVISSISGVDLVLIVAEPSLSGISDMKRILETCHVFNTKSAVCINKYDTSIETAKKIQQFCEDENIPFIGKIPYDAHVPQAINEGKSIAAIECPARIALKEVYNKVIKLLNY